MLKVSVIVGVYNSEKYLRKCIESLVNQTYENIEIILINNASIDKSQNIIEKFSEEFPTKIKFFNTSEKLGAGGARNKGMEFATGDYVCFVDNDDSVSKTYLEELIKSAEKQKKLPDIVICNFKKVDIQGKVLYERNFLNKEEALFQSIAPWGKIFNKEYLIKNELILRNMPFGEDVIFAVELYLTQPVIALCSTLGYYWLDNPTSASHTEIRNFPENSVEKAIEYFEYMSIKYPERYDILTYFVVKYFTWYLLQSGRNTGPQRMKEEYKKAFNYIRTKFPNYKRNVYISPFKLWQERKIVRVAVWGIIIMEKIEISKVFFCTYSRFNLEKLWPKL